MLIFVWITLLPLGWQAADGHGIQGRRSIDCQPMLIGQVQHTNEAEMH